MDPTYRTGQYVLVNKALYTRLNIEAISDHVPLWQSHNRARYLFRPPQRACHRKHRRHPAARVTVLHESRRLSLQIHKACESQVVFPRKGIHRVDEVRREQQAAQARDPGYHPLPRAGCQGHRERGVLPEPDHGHPDARLDELLDRSDRILVFSGGRVAPPIDARQATVEQLGEMIGGKGF